MAARNQRLQRLYACIIAADVLLQSRKLAAGLLESNPRKPAKKSSCIIAVAAKKKKGLWCVGREEEEEGR